MQESPLASFAAHSSASRGRLYPESESITRSKFQRDRDRIIHCAAFRRLEYKTQVFVNHEGDHYRTRLTHSLEVAQIARSISKLLQVNDDLAEALALAHDLGHTPFGHAGEDALADVMADYGGFDHNAQTIKILTQLEHRYAEFDGLNLTWETLEGIAKHNGPLTGPYGSGKPLSRVIRHYNARHDLELESFPSAEAQIASISDDIAYNNHDIDDGLRAGILSIHALKTLPLVGDSIREVERKYPNISEQRLIHESIRRLIGVMIHDVVDETRKNIERYNIQTIDDIRKLDRLLVTFSPTMQESNLVVKSFLHENMYRHYKVNRMTTKARRIVSKLFKLLHKEPECLPTEWHKLTIGKSKKETAIIVADFIAGMTDRFAIKEYKSLFGSGN